MADAISVVLFEDTTATQSTILGALQKHLGSEGNVVLFDGKLFQESAADKERTYEDRIESILRTPPFDRTTIIVADRDLSKSVSTDFRGLSVNAVATAADRLAIPICSYAREPERDDYDWRGRWEEGHIVLKFAEGEDELARRATVAARGFARIARELPAASKVAANDSPAKLLAALLEKPEYSDKIALYSVGDQNRLAEVLAKPKDDVQQARRLTCFVGYWLWDSLLRYPGLLVNEIAAASHLNLAPDDFKDGKVRPAFDEALYHGPFEDQKKPQWWRGMLDNIISREGCTDGLAFIQKKVKADAKRSTCYVDPARSAGYYCIIAQLPVSLENSKGGLKIGR